LASYVALCWLLDISRTRARLKHVLRSSEQNSPTSAERASERDRPIDLAHAVPADTGAAPRIGALAIAARSAGR